MHIVKYRDCLLRAVQNSRTDQDAILDVSQVGPGNMYYMGCRCPHRKRHFWGYVTAWKALWSIGFWGLCERASCAKNGRTDLSNLYAI